MTGIKSIAKCLMNDAAFEITNNINIQECETKLPHYGDVIMGSMASQFTSLTIVYSTVYLGTDQRKHQSCAQLAFVRGIHRGPVNSPHKWPVTRKMFPFDDVIMPNLLLNTSGICSRQKADVAIWNLLYVIWWNYAIIPHCDINVMHGI